MIFSWKILKFHALLFWHGHKISDHKTLRKFDVNDGDVHHIKIVFHDTKFLKIAWNFTNTGHGMTWNSMCFVGYETCLRMRVIII